MTRLSQSVAQFLMTLNLTPIVNVTLHSLHLSSITVRFSNLTKKDKVLRGYKNFHPNRKPKQVRVYQSMTPYYKLLKNNITDYFKRLQVKVKWVHWRSSTAGMCVKLDNGKLLSKLFCFADVEAAYLPSNGTR